MYSIQLPPRYGEAIKAAEVREDMVYVETANGAVWRLWIDLDSREPICECIQWPGEESEELTCR